MSESEHMHFCNTQQHFWLSCQWLSAFLGMPKTALGFQPGLSSYLAPLHGFVCTAVLCSCVVLLFVYVA